MSNYKTPADLGIEAVRAEKRIKAILSEFSDFVIDLLDDHRDTFKDDFSYIKACLDFYQELKENMEDEEVSTIDEVLDQEKDEYQSKADLEFERAYINNILK